MRALRIENEQLRQRLERMERRVRGGDISPVSSPRPPSVKTASAAIPATPTAVEATPSVHNSNKRTRKRSAEAVSADTEHRQPATKMIKLEMPATNVSFSSSRRNIPTAYSGGSSRCDFPLAHCLDNLTDEIFAESDESFSTSYDAPAAEGFRPNGVVDGDYHESRLDDDRKSDYPAPGGQQRDEVEEENNKSAVVAAADRPAKKLSSQKLLEVEAKLVKKRSRGAGRPPSRPSITLSVPGIGYLLNVIKDKMLK